MQKRIFAQLGEASVDLSSNISHRIFEQDLLFVERRTIQETIFLLTNATFLTLQGVLGFFGLLFAESVLLLLMLALLLFVNPFLTIFIIVYFVALLGVLNKFSRKATKKYSRILNDSLVDSSKEIQESLQSFREVYATQKMSSIIKFSTVKLMDTVESRAFLSWLSLLPKYILDAATIFGIVLVGGFAWIQSSERQAISVSVVFLVAASRIMPSLLRINTGFQGISNCSDASDRVYLLLNEIAEAEGVFKEPATTEDQEELNRFEYQVKNLRFRYPNSEAEVLRDITFNITPGEFLAIVGPSGAGKSTLVDLLMGVIRDSSDAIKIGANSPREMVKKNPGILGYVPQRVVLMNRTLKENIALGVPIDQIDIAAVWEALDKSALSSFVSALPGGLETIVAEGGNNLSGGQVQRIGLARALYSRPKILILDEATSALDAETEKEISDALNSLRGKMTLIVVAHRLATVKKADRILYLAPYGTQSTMGTFEELRKLIPSFDKQAELLGL
jgi:ABC-type multidrug transport system fused ATPase/permease subunit